MLRKQKNFVIVDLLQPARKGDSDSLNLLAEVVQERIYSYIYRATGDYDVSLDLTQETQLALLRNLSRLHSCGAFWPWVYRIAQSKVQQHYRQQQKRPRLLFSTLAEEGNFDPPAKQDSSVLSWMEKIERFRLIHAALDRIRDYYAEIIQLRCFEKLSYLEISTRLNCTEQQARIGFCRAKKSLRMYYSMLLS